MPEARILSREQALAVLRRHGIWGAEVYLIDLIPLVEMIWADGKAQESEIAVLDDYLARHVASLNELAGYEMISRDSARAFLCRFLRERPDPQLLRTLRSLVAAVRLSGSDEKRNAALRSSLLAACVDIAASAGAADPNRGRERFDAEEKRSFFEILESLEKVKDRRS